MLRIQSIPVQKLCRRCSGDIAFEQEWIESAASSRTQSCLTVVQDQILNHSSSLGGSISQDASIQIAAAPDIYREAEAVFNSILHNLESDPSLNTTDISVMVPDMDRYGPVLQSVFSRPPQRVAFSMIDCSAMRESHYANGVSALLDLLAGSFNRNDVFTLASNRCFLAAARKQRLLASVKTSLRLKDPARRSRRADTPLA